MNKYTKKLILPVILVIIIIIILRQLLFVINVAEQSVVTRFGQIVATHTEPGLKIKIPFIDQVNIFTKRIMSWDGLTDQLPTSDDKRVLLDTTARWQISNPAVFYSRLNSQQDAYNKLDNIIDSRVRSVIGSYPMNEIVRSSNSILEQLDSEESLLPAEDEFVSLENSGTEDIIDDFVIEPVNLGRSELVAQILELSREEINEETMGITIVDVIVRQVQYPDKVSDQVYKRMVSERNKLAAKQRSLGNGAKERAQGEMERDSKIIIAKAESEVAELYRDAYEKDPEFYKFWRAMDSYQQSLPDLSKTLSTDMEYFDYMYSSTGDR